MQQLDFLEILEQPSLVCPACKKIFEKKSKYHPHQKYCSNKCNSKTFYQRNKKEINYKQRLYYEKNKEKIKKSLLKRKEKIKEQRKKYRLKNIEKLKEYKKKYYLKNIETIKEKLKQYNIINNKERTSKKREHYQNNKEEIKKRNRIYLSKNKELNAERCKKYRLKNIEKIKEQRKLYRIKNRKKLDEISRKNRWKYNHKQNQYRNNYIKRLKVKYPEKYYKFKIKNILRSRVCTALISQNAIKTKKTLELLGCSWQEARDHIQSQFKEGMTWENHGFYGWHIDHIIPCASFDLFDPEQQKKCFHYTNLQPLWGHENISKGAKLPPNTIANTIGGTIANTITIPYPCIEGGGHSKPPPL